MHLYLPPAALASLMTVIPVAEDTQRYLDTDLKIQNSHISPDGLQAQVQGTILSFAEQPDATTVWIAAFAYDVDENIVGIRKWVSNNVLVSGEQIEYDLTVYSLGPKISRVELMVEARP